MIGGLIARHTITVIRAARVDDGRGNLGFDWVNAVQTLSGGWAVDAGATGEDTTNRDGASVAYTVRGPYTADVEATDRVWLLGEIFDVVGVARQPGASPLTSHTVLQLSRWAG